MAPTRMGWSSSAAGGGSGVASRRSVLSAALVAAVLAAAALLWLRPLAESSDRPLWPDLADMRPGEHHCRIHAPTADIDCARKATLGQVREWYHQVRMYGVAPTINTNIAPHGEKITPVRPRIAIMSYFSPPKKPVNRYMTPMAHHSQLSRRLYAERHGYDVIWEDEMLRVPGRTEHWGKLLAIAKWLPKYDWIWWLDVDALITNHTLPVESIIDTYGNNGASHLLISRDDRYVNSGSMFLRCSSEMLRFLRAVASAPPSWKIDKVYEQGPIDDLVFKMFTSPFLVETRWSVFVPPALINVAPPGWCVVMAEWQPGDLIVHFPGYLACADRYKPFAMSAFPPAARRHWVEVLRGQTAPVGQDVMEPCCLFEPRMTPELRGGDLPAPMGADGYGVFAQPAAGDFVWGPPQATSN